jgi:hypothetical protein
MKYRELTRACRNNFGDHRIETVLVEAETSEAQKELSKNNPVTEGGYKPVTSGAGFSIYHCGDDGALGDMEVISVGIKDETTIVVHL